MQIAIAAVGRMKKGPERELVTRYLARGAAAGRGLALNGYTVSEVPESRAQDTATRKRDEARALQSLAPAGGAMVVLDERAGQLDSERFAQKLEAWRDRSLPAVTLVIGGPDGHDPELVASADFALGLSAMTWPHQLVRIMLAEQLYRATMILSGHPYHRGD